jgi:hypothetical protein
VALLQGRRFAHLGLNASNVLVLDDRCTLVDLRLADYAATDELLGVDVAELLVSTSCIVGPEMAIAHAVKALSAGELARAVPLVQPAVLTSNTRAAARASEKRTGLDKNELLDEVRDQLADAARVEQVVIRPVQRITIQGTVALVGGIVLGGYLLNLASNWDDTWEAFTTADLAYVPPIIVLMIITYLSGAWSLMGATSVHLSFTRPSAVMVGQSFLNRFTPANAGGMAMRVCYLQLNGSDGTVAGATIGLTSAASGVAQVILIVVYLIWGGASDRFSDFEFPDTGVVLIIMVVIGLIVWVRAGDHVGTHGAATVARRCLRTGERVVRRGAAQPTPADPPDGRLDLEQVGQRDRILVERARLRRRHGLRQGGSALHDRQHDRLRGAHPGGRRRRRGGTDGSADLVRCRQRHRGCNRAALPHADILAADDPGLLLHAVHPARGHRLTRGFRPLRSAARSAILVLGP